MSQTLVELLIEADYPAESITLLMSNPVDQWSEENEDDESVRALHQTQECFIEEFDFSTADIVFLCGDKDQVEDLIDEAIKAEAMLIDLSGFSAEHDHLPLVLNALNSHELQGLTRGFVVAVPSAAAAMLSEIVYPLSQHWELEKIAVSHLNPAADLGKIGVDGLAGQTARLMNGMSIEKSTLSKQLAFNLLPQCGAIDDMGYAEQELRLISQTKRLLNNELLQVNATCIQAPVFYVQSQVIELGFFDPVDIQSVKSLLQQNQGISIVKPEMASVANIGPDEKSGAIVVSRLRQKDENEQALTLWCAADSLRRCTVGNAVQIAEILIKSYL